MRFLAASSLMNFGLSIFFLLYNLGLLQRGYRENLVGLIAAAMTMGTLAGTLPAGLAAHRFGLKPTLLLAFVATPLICAVRALVSDPILLVGAAFLGGFSFSFYAVSLPPCVARLAPERARALAFSLVFSLGIGMAALGAAAGGAVPALLGGIKPALLAATAVAALGALIALKLQIGSAPAAHKRIYPSDPAIKRYLAAIALWSIATGSFNSFANVYFSTQLGSPVRVIGFVFSASQLVQTLAVMAAPLVLRRFGLATGIMAMQMATAAALGLLAFEPPLAGAAVLYACYMSAQYMSEPGMYTFLMARAKEEERGGASALNFLVLLSGQAIAAALSGFAIRRFGYGAVLIVAAILAAIAGIYLRTALSSKDPDQVLLMNSSTSRA